MAMRIGLIAPPWIAVPPPAYGGTEAVLDCLARGLTDLGHEVRLFTVGESTCPVRRAARYPTAVKPMGSVAYELAHALSAYEELADVDVIHDHTLAGALVAAGAARSEARARFSMSRMASEYARLYARLVVGAHDRHHRHQRPGGAGTAGTPAEAMARQSSL
jgi:hypothetical protein